MAWPRSTAEKLGREGFQGEEEELNAREVLVNLLTGDLVRSLVALAEGFCGMMGVGDAGSTEGEQELGALGGLGL